MICAHANKWRKWHHKWSHSCLGMGLNCLVRLVKKHWTGALLNVKCCCFVQKRSWKSHTILNQPVCRKRRRRRRFWEIFFYCHILCVCAIPYISNLLTLLSITPYPSTKLSWRYLRHLTVASTAVMLATRLQFATLGAQLWGFIYVTRGQKNLIAMLTRFSF